MFLEKSHPVKKEKNSVRQIRVDWLILKFGVFQKTLETLHSFTTPDALGGRFRRCGEFLYSRPNPESPAAVWP